MKRFMLIFAILCFSGCASHYCRKTGDRLTMYLNLTGVEAVDFASSLDGFKIHRAFRVNPSTWAVTLPATDRFSYFYIVDGNVHIPPCRLCEQDDFGSKNCIYVPGM